MSQMTSKLTIALAGLAVASLPVLVDAQGTSTPQTKPGQTATTPQQNRSNRSTGENSAQHHLDEAKRVLSSVNHTSLQGEARTKVTELKRHFMQLEGAWRASSANSARTGASRSTEPTSAGTTTGSATGTTQGTAGTSGTATGSETTEQTGTSNRQSPRAGYPSTGRAAGDDWMTHYQAIDNILQQLNVESTGGASSQADAAARTGAGSSTGATAGSATGTTSGTASGSTAGTSGTAAGTTGSAGERTGASASADVTLDAAVRTKLSEFKKHLDQFHSTAMAQSGRGEEDAASANPNSGITGAMTGTGSAARPTGTTASSVSQPATTSHETPEATGTSGTSSTTAGTAGTSGTSGTMTGTAGTSGSPSAQTTGSASSASGGQRPQGTATTPTSAAATVDSAAIARLTASIDEMLRGSASTSTAAGTTTGTSGSTSSTTSTTGTSGTSGTASATGTVCVDRAKLEELKTQLQALQNRPR